MTTVNRLKNRTKNVNKLANQAQQQSSLATRQKSAVSQQQKPFQGNNLNKHSPLVQKQYQGYIEVSLSNPNGIATSCSVFPHSAAMNQNFKVPLAFIMSPMLSLQNQCQPMNKNVDSIPRCATCRAYMNCYNSIEKKKFTCFLCNRDNYFDQNYIPNEAPNQEFNSSIYQAMGSENFYSKPASEQAFIFMLDTSQDQFNQKYLYYATAAIKQVLSRPDLDDILIYFFTYDQVVFYYQFACEEVKCVVFDQSISSPQKFPNFCLKDIRDNLFDLLDNLSQIYKSSHRKGYNFSRCFNFIYSNLKYLGGKFFIFQSNEAIARQQGYVENEFSSKKGTVDPTNYNSKSQSFYEPNNKLIFDKYAEQMLNFQCSISYFCFFKNYKNIRAWADVAKLTCSQLKLYNKDSAEDLNSFYYDLSYLLGATYFKNVRIQYVISAGWALLGIYGNYYRIKNTLCFQISYLDPSRKITVFVSPSPNFNSISPFCGLQMILNYRYKKTNFITIATIVQPVTGYAQKLYKGINVIESVAALAKKFLSFLRIDTLFNVKKVTNETACKIYSCALQVFKNQKNIPDSVFTILLSLLAMLKSPHTHPDLLNGTYLLDKLVAERNILQFSGQCEIANRFNPFLFDVTNLEPEMCLDQQEFIYPSTVELKFQNVNSGLYLLDNGLALYLFIAKQCDSSVLKQVFGKSKITKNDMLNEDLLTIQESQRANKVKNLIKILREQKMYGWIPLYIVKCGEGTETQKNFYLSFYAQNYIQFKSYKLSFGEFLNNISKN